MPDGHFAFQLLVTPLYLLRFLKFTQRTLLDTETFPLLDHTNSLLMKAPTIDVGSCCLLVYHVTGASVIKRFVSNPSLNSMAYVLSVLATFCERRQYWYSIWPLENPQWEVMAFSIFICSERSNRDSRRYLHSELFSLFQYFLLY